MRERAAIPVQRRVDVRAGADVVEPAIVAMHEHEVQAIGMTVPCPGVAVVERRVQRAVVAPQNRESLLRRAAPTPATTSASGGSARHREQERTPTEIRCDRAPLPACCARPRPSTASGRCRGARRVSVVQRRERAGQPIVVRLPDESELGQLGEAPLPQRHAVLRVATRRKREIRQRGDERRGERLVEPRDERRIERRAGRLSRSSRRTRGRDARTDDSSRPRTRCRRRAGHSLGARTARTGRASADSSQRSTEHAATPRGAPRCSRPVGSTAPRRSSR